MFCPSCGKENNEENLFCVSCGSKLKEREEDKSKEVVNINNNSKKGFKINHIFQLFKGKNKKKGIITCCSFIVVISFILFGIIYLDNPITKFKNDVQNNDATDAVKVYNDKIKGNTDKETKVDSCLKDDILEIERSFVEERIDFDKAKNELDTIRNTYLVTTDVNNTFDKISKLNDSRVSFKKAEAYLKNNDYLNAIKEYKNVISDDKNYEKAKEQIKNNENKYKEQALKNAETSATSKDYKQSVSILKDALIVIPNDADLTAKLTVYQNQLQDSLLNEQQAIVQDAEIIIEDTRYKALYPDLMEVIIKNASTKTIKDMKVGFLGYDANGYPLKIKTQFASYDSDYEFVGNADDVNILPNAVLGFGQGWKLDESHGISKILACVKTVTYYDGTTWDNPYYEYWIEQHKEKPLN